MHKGGNLLLVVARSSKNSSGRPPLERAFSRMGNPSTPLLENGRCGPKGSASVLKLCAGWKMVEGVGQFVWSFVLYELKSPAKEHAFSECFLWSGCFGWLSEVFFSSLCALFRSLQHMFGFKKSSGRCSV